MRGVTVGDRSFTVVAGLCVTGDPGRFREVARGFAASGADMLRGAAPEAGSWPDPPEPLGEEGLRALADLREATGLPVIAEAADVESVGLVEGYVDVIAIGCRNMQNFSLLRQVGRTRKPALLERGMWATLEEFLMAAEYVLAEGNGDLILCERGVRTFSGFSGSTLDLSVVPAVKQASHLPILVDPSHGADSGDGVLALARAAAAAGADGVSVSVQAGPEDAASEPSCAVTLRGFEALVATLRRLAPATRSGP